jgi:integrase
MLMSFRFVVRQQKIQEVKLGNLYETIKTFLCIKDLETGMIFPHPLTNFIKGEFIDRPTALTTQKRYAEDIKKFLNFILDCIDEEDEMFIPLEEKGLKELKILHGVKYLNFLKDRVDMGQIKPKAVYDAERLLTRFYSWLIYGKIIDEKVNILYDTRKIGGREIHTPRSLFKRMDLGVEFPAKESEEMIKARKLHDFGDGRLDLIKTLLRVSELVCPEIALGIAFQCYAGLRKGEVINLTRSSIKKPNKNGTGQFNLDIKNNWRTLFPNKEIAVGEQVKKPRIQAVFKTDIVMELLTNHEERLKRLQRQGKIKNEHAFFISNQGNPISGKEYWKRFTKVKDKFLRVVLTNDLLDEYEILTSKPWSTHIGRGIYTNMLTFLLGWSAEEVAIARGDSNLISAQRYIEEMNVRKKTEESLEILGKASLETGTKRILTIEDLRSIK